MNKTLRELNASLLDAGGPGIYQDLNGQLVPAPRRKGIGVIMDCPCGCDTQLYVPFQNPIDRGSPVDSKGWRRQGETLDDLTLSPSVFRNGHEDSCGWHGWIRDGKAVSV